MHIDDLLEQIDLNNDTKPQNTRERNRRSFMDPPKLGTQKISNDPYEFDSILKSQDSPVDRQSTFVPIQDHKLLLQMNLKSKNG